MSFVDTNVLVYATVEGAPFQDRARAALLRVAPEETAAVSRQVLREYLAVVTRPQTWGRPLSLAAAMADAAVFASRFRVLEDGPVVWDSLRALAKNCDFAGRQVHDANIVATMLAYSELRLLTFNVSDFRRFEAAIELIAA